MKAVVPGSAGFIGSHLFVDRLIVRGYTLVGIGRRLRAGWPGYRHARADLSEHRQVETLADTTRCRRALGSIPRTDHDALVRKQLYATARLSAPVVT